MKNYVWLSACVAITATALVAGCGGGGDSTAPATTPSVATAPSLSTSTTTEASGNATPDDVYNACLDALKDVSNQQVVQQGCANARDAFEQCATQASNAPEGSARDTALEACQEVANETVAGLESSN
jgi:hypothetical protein